MNNPNINDPKEMLDKVISSLQGVLPASLAEDMKTNIIAVVSKAVKELDSVSREELDVQMEVLAKTREQLNMLEEKLTELESKI